MTGIDPASIATLALDTSTGALSLCARRGDTWAALTVDRGLHHSPALIPLAERLLRDLDMTVLDLQLIVCSIGPGSFTGIRIGIATALGIGHGRGIPVVGVSTLDALGRSWETWDGDVFPVIDARRGNIYTAHYRDGSRKGEYADLSPADLAGHHRRLARASPGRGGRSAHCGHGVPWRAPGAPAREGFRRRGSARAAAAGRRDVCGAGR